MTGIPILLLSLMAFVPAGAKSQKTQKAHVHGKAELSLAFDQEKGSLQFETPAFAIVGFEHSVKSEVDRKKVQMGIDEFEKQVSKMIHFEEGLRCRFEKEKVQVQSDEHQHSDFVAIYNLHCTRSPLGTSIRFDFKKFPKLEKVEVTILVGDLQKSITVKSQPAQIELKP